MFITELYGMGFITIVKEFNTMEEVIKYIESTGYNVTTSMIPYMNNLEIRYPFEYKAMRIRRI